MQMNPDNAETLTKWYLRLNGYFTVENFIVHAADDPTRISKGTVGNYTEVDALAVRHQFSKEVTGTLQILNDPKLISDQNVKIDFVIAETKTRKENRPNKIWRDKNLNAIKYIIRFAGFIETEEIIAKVAKELSENHQYIDPAGNFRIRLILFSEKELAKNWKSISNITFDDIIDFIVNIRGTCWVDENIGVASIHYQWDELMNKIFSVANDLSKGTVQRKTEIKTILQKGPTP